jgi:hypothetical protein
VLAVLCALSVDACATFSEPVSVDVKNDLPNVVTLEVCASRVCHRTTDPWVLRPGRVGHVNVEAQGGYNSAIVVGSRNEVIGCLPFRLSDRSDAAGGVRVSQAVPCGAHGGADAAGNKDWPDPNQ